METALVILAALLPAMAIESSVVSKGTSMEGGAFSLWVWICINCYRDGLILGGESDFGNYISKHAYILNPVQLVGRQVYAEDPQKK